MASEYRNQIPHQRRKAGQGVIISVASGKGGTGKTTIAANLARISQEPVQLLDCDVEAPNCRLFFSSTLLQKQTVTIPVPEVDTSRCKGCGECGKLCVWGAIIVPRSKPMVFPELCHGCGGCAAVCPEKAIRECGRRIGVVEVLDAEGIALVQGRLDVGISLVPPLIRSVKTHLRRQGVAILDAPPGISCPVVTTIRDSDVAVLVTEPTPFGLHDFKLAVETVRELKIPFGAIVNRFGIGDDRIQEYCRQAGIPILLVIPDDRRVAEAYSRGRLMVDVLPEYRDPFEKTLAKIIALANPPIPTPGG